MMPFNWNGDHGFYEPLVKALSPISHLQVHGLDTTDHGQAHLFIEHIKVSSPSSLTACFQVAHCAGLLNGLNATGLAQFIISYN